MPTTNLTKYCCQSADYAFEHFNFSIDCTKTYTIVLTSATPLNAFIPPWDANRAIARTCPSVDNCITGDRIYVRYYVGCLPRFNFPFRFTYDVLENGVVIDSGTEYVEFGLSDCPNGTCPEICT